MRTGGEVALLLPATGEIRTVAWEPDVASLARREIDCRVVERLRLGQTLLLPRGVQIWLDGNGPSSPRPINRRAGAVVLACLPSQCGPARLLRKMVVGPVLLCAGPDPQDNPLGLNALEAEVLAWAITNLEHRSTARRRGLRKARP